MDVALGAGKLTDQSGDLAEQYVRSNLYRKSLPLVGPGWSLSSVLPDQIQWDWAKLRKEGRGSLEGSPNSLSHPRE